MKKIYSYAEAINSGLDYILKKIPNDRIVKYNSFFKNQLNL